MTRNQRIHDDLRPETMVWWMYCHQPRGGDSRSVSIINCPPSGNVNPVIDDNENTKTSVCRVGVGYHMSLCVSAEYNAMICSWKCLMIAECDVQKSDPPTVNTEVQYKGHRAVICHELFSRGASQ